MKRRTFLTAAGATVATTVAGCSGIAGESEPDDERTLVVGTYSAFIDAPSTSPGAWLKEQFESEFDARLIWQTPENEVNHYIERKNAGVDTETDVYVGLNVDDLVRIDDQLDDGLFAEAGDVEGADSVKSQLSFDPDNRAVPFDTGYVSLVYDGTSMTAPETFEGLLAEDVAGDLIAQNPASSATGRAFLLHTVAAFGPDGYLDYWADLQANDVRVLGSWSDAYSAWSAGEAPMVVSYSTDQVFADRNDANLEKHQIRFLNDQGYANPEGMAVFADANEPELAREFMSFLLRPEVQGEIAVRNVAFPATTDAALPEDYAELAKEPPEPVTFTYDELQGSVSGWIEAWERQFAEN
ncbi:thiamine ABC transporter substrate binding subunit [Halomicroarcula sp. GCM10025324]|uniref:thiamine ABC transporter substrate-binding protein n=1 Tax=Haloarcula TaxID=2237 RepID=UPI0023E7E58B|nr:thiamine ABC transporter substrate-binding protein [Halomicroarcula sp. ZS-22-S1]